MSADSLRQRDEIRQILVNANLANAQLAGLEGSHNVQCIDSCLLDELRDSRYFAQKASEAMLPILFERERTLSAQSVSGKMSHH